MKALQDSLVTGLLACALVQCLGDDLLFNLLVVVLEALEGGLQHN